MIINHTRCDTVHLGTLANIGNVRILEINIRIFKKYNTNTFACKRFDLLGIIRKEVTHSGVEKIKFYNS